jgi:hypothetical protein
MTLRNLLITTAVATGLGGLGFLFFTGNLLSFYGIDGSNAGTLLLARYLGAGGIGFAALTWLLRNAGDPVDRRGLVLALFIGWGAMLVVSFVGIGLSPNGWIETVVSGLFTLGYGYFQFTTSGGSSAPRPMPSAMSMPAASAAPRPAAPKAAAKAPARKTPARRRR